MINFFGAKNSELEQELTHCRTQLSDSEDLLAAFSKASAIIQFTPEGQILEANDNFLAAMGYSMSELRGQHHKIFCLPEVVQSPEYAQLWSSLAAGKQQTGEIQRVTKSGRRVWLSASYCPVFNKQGTVVKVVKIASDITESIDSLAELRSEKEAVSRSMAVIEFTPAGEILWANDNFLGAVGYSLDELKGKHHRIFCTPEYASSDDYRRLWERLNQGEYIADKIDRVSKSGEILKLQATYNPICNSHGELFKVMKFATDITANSRAAHATAELAFDASKRTDEATMNGSQKSAAATNAMQQVAEGLKHAAEQINSLSEQSEQITNIVSTITSIADQTNLLALNAAIEAARAGEQGRGFAVVAEEVRNLAARTSDSTAEIDGVVRQNNEYAAEAVKAVDALVIQAQEGMEQVSETVQAMKDIGAGSKEMVNALQDMARQLE